MASTHFLAGLQVAHRPGNRDRRHLALLPGNRDRHPRLRQGPLDRLLSHHQRGDPTSQLPRGTRTSWLTAPHARRARRNTRNPGGVADPVSWESW